MNKSMKDKIYKYFWILFGLTISGIVFGVSLLIYFSFGLPKISTLADYRPPIPSQILARDGTVIADIGSEKREIINFDEIPKVVVDAFLSAEDDNFFKHEGVDYMGIMRAMWINLKEGKVAQGGSTITQQVAKSLLLSRKRSYVRKIKDILLAQKIEKKFSKEEILFLYLNQVYLGGGYYGVKTAFRGYFGKELSEASIAECAMVAGLLVAPGRYSPYINPEFAKKRQQYVLGRMLGTGKITQEQFNEAVEEKIKYRLRKFSDFKAGYFTDWIRQRVVKLVGEEEFLKGGFKVQTTLDWELQKVAEKASLEGSKAIDKRQGYKGPLVHLDTSQGIGSFEYEFRKKMYEKKSEYFTIGKNYIKEYELEFNEEKYIKLQERSTIWREELNNKRFIPGVNPDDNFVELLEINQNYKAVVTKVEDWGRIIYVSIGGIPGIIPYSMYRWAHKREISEKHQYLPFVIKPSSILKRGDVIQIKLHRKSVSLRFYAEKPFVNHFDKIKEIDKVKKERYLLCELDQDADAQVALFSIQPKTGEVISLVGGVDFNKSKFNRALQSRRQPGSAFKPILYAAGLENKFTPATLILDSPEALGSADENLNWKPRNYDGKFLGDITFRNSLEKSRNVPTIKIADKITVPTILAFADRILMNAEIDKDLSMALGSFGVTLLDLVSTYAIFPNEGRIVDVKSILSITDRDGNEYHLDESTKSKKIFEREEAKKNADQETKELEAEKLAAEPDAMPSEEVTEEKKEEVNEFHISLGGDQVYDSRLAYLMTNLLRGVVQNGTGRSAREVSQFIGGKTGTTNSYVDAWFIGFSSTVATGVWTGFDDNNTLGWGETGAKSALPIWKEYMKASLKKYGEYDFKAPAGIVNVMIDKKTGKLAQEERANAFMEAFVEGTEPKHEEDEAIITEEEIMQESEKRDTTILEDDEYFNNQ